MNDYKAKYLNLRAKMMEVADVSFRLGYEQGAKDSQVQFMQQQMQQMQQQQMQEQAMMQQQMQGGAEGDQPMSPEEQQMMAAQQGLEQEDGGEMTAPEEEQAAPSELDSKIDELESLVAKGEKPSVVSLRKAVEQIAEIRKSQKQKLNSRQQKETTAQKKFVDNILKKWEEETKDLSEGIEDVIKQHGLKLGE